jgi:sulfatase modifying factor 1
MSTTSGSSPGAEDHRTGQPVRGAARNPARHRLRNMAWVPGGSFWMGSAGFYPEERPVHRVSVDGFWMDEHPVTVEEFRRFVKATRYVTVAERPLDPAAYPGADPALLVPGSLVFQRTLGPVDLRDYRSWWAYIPGASWRCPDGPGSDCRGRERHPVTQVACQDAESYAAWAGKELPAEAEWEYAARGGLDGAVYPWGDEPAPGGQMMANTWQGQFPWQNLLTDGYAGTSPVGSFPANGHGLCDMAGNVWEWTCDYFTPRHPPAAAGACCPPRNPRVSSPASSDMTAGPGSHLPRRVIKGGSYLCAPSYCLRYRPAARQGEAIDTATCHLGFRCVIRGSSPPVRGH